MAGFDDRSKREKEVIEKRYRENQEFLKKEKGKKEESKKDHKGIFGFFSNSNEESYDKPNSNLQNSQKSKLNKHYSNEDKQSNLPKQDLPQGKERDYSKDNSIINELFEEIDHAQSTEEKWKSKYFSLKKENDLLQKRLEDENTQNNILKSSLEGKVGEINSLRKETKEYEGKIKRYEEEIPELQECKTRYENMINLMKNKVEDLKRKKEENIKKESYLSKNDVTQ